MNEIELPPSYPLFCALGQQGNYVRKAVSVGELPHSMRLDALKVAAQVLGVQQIQYGVPIYRTLGMTKTELMADRRQWLRFSGESLPLSLFWDESNSEEEA